MLLKSQTRRPFTVISYKGNENGLIQLLLLLKNEY